LLQTLPSFICKPTKAMSLLLRGIADGQSAAVPLSVQPIYIPPGLNEQPYSNGGFAHAEES
jgi:hypothetical protein